MNGRWSAHLVLAVAISGVLVASDAQAGITWHVDVKSSGPAHDGTSWCHAFRSLHEALNAATAGDRIRVAQGVYKPDPTGLPSPRDATFRLPSGVSLEGGYAGCGAVNPDDRDFGAFETRLSGDLGGNDGPNFVNYAENCFHVVTYEDPNATNVMFEGFTVSGGNANGPNGLTNQGGGIHIRQGLIKCIPGGPTIRHCIIEYNRGTHHGAINDHGLTTVIENCTIRNNYAGIEGGGLQIHSGSPMISNCLFLGNVSDGEGGGAWVGKDTDPTCTGGSTATFTNCVFDDNTGDLGGGLFTATGTGPTVIGCTFIRNTTTVDGAGIYSEPGSEIDVQGSFFIDNIANNQGGGVYNTGNAPTYTGCVFRGNSAGLYAGAMRNLSSHPVLTDCVFADNFSASNGGAFHNRLSHLTFVRCSFFGNIAATGGGAIFNIGQSRSTLTSSLFSGNRGTTGGAIANRDGSFSTLHNCTLNANEGFLSVGGIDNDTQSSATLTNSIVWNQIGSQFGGPGGAAKTTASFSNVQGTFPGLGNINAAPVFVDADGADNVAGTEDDDLRMKQGSPGINVGDPSFTPGAGEDDLAGEPRLVECRVDMGSYESNVLQKPADFNGDQVVNLADFAKFQLCAFHPAAQEAWRDTCVCVFDQNDSVFVDLADYARFPWDLLPCNEGDESCDDGDGCNGEEQCVDGVCLPGTPLECNDGNICTDDACAGGKCANVHNDVVCDDGSACTSGDRCEGGLCVGGGPALVCNDHNPCTDDSCDPAEGCVVVNDNSNSCSDGDACTVGDVCSNGSCEGGNTVDCSSVGGVCATADCDPAGVEGNCAILTPLPNDADCSDGNACTVGESCQNGECGGGIAPDCLSFDTSCRTVSCNPAGAEGNCDTVTPVPDGTTCNDGQACLVGETCQGGECTSGTVPNCAAFDGTCQTASCDPAGPEGNCDTVTPVPDGTGCDDSDECTMDDSCGDGVCVGGSSKVCDDGNPCTDDSCDAKAGCVFSNNDANSCSDGNACTAGDHCENGECLPGLTVHCPTDNNPCTDDFCHASIGCVSEPNDNNACADNNVCNGEETCDGGKCISGQPLDCPGDDNACTVESCDTAQGCQSQPDDGQSCTDGNGCTAGDFCSGGTCIGGSIPDCSLSNTDCQTASCDPAGDEGNCNQMTPVPDGTPCDDGLACMVGETCQGGSCVTGTAQNCSTSSSVPACRTASCDPNGAEGNCDASAVAPDGTTCDDHHDCTINDVCTDGHCRGEEKNCPPLP